MTGEQTPILSLRAVQAAYDGIIVGLRGVTLEVTAGRIVALLGGNGAGKTTTLKAASGLLRAEGGEVTEGGIEYRGQSIVGTPARDLVRAGLVQVLEGRHCFPQLTIEENLITGALFQSPSRRRLLEQLERVYQWFPQLKKKRAALAGYASGGEQQMTAIGRALMGTPKLVLLDEPSMGLAPVLVAEIFEIIRTLNRDTDVSFLLAEQNAMLALRYADYGYVLGNGCVAAQGTASELSQRDDIRNLYLGELSETTQRNGKHFRAA